MNAIVHESKRAAPLEACGILFGRDNAVADWQPAANVAADPGRRFEIDPGALIAAYRRERSGGQAVLGWWHSHPSGVAVPSQTDAAMAAPDGRIWLIVAGDEVRAWRAVAGGSMVGRFDPVPLDLT
ncbi:M67 family metallopeptidase [Sphingomonas sp. CJ99]